MLIICADAKLAPITRLNNGYEMPMIGLGTFEVIDIINLIYIINSYIRTLIIYNRLMMTSFG